MTHALYNEIEPFAASWIRALIDRGHVAPGVVDERSIEDLTPADVGGDGQRHFFAGIGGWSYALRLAGVRDDANIWTGSCPCQPFSQAGRQGGTADPRHLWPAWFRLIRECRPAIVFGEQVAGPAGLGWLDGVVSDLEGSGYAVGASVLSAGGASAPHARHRIYFVAYAGQEQRGWWPGVKGSAFASAPERGEEAVHDQRSGVGDADGLAGGRNARAVSRAQGTDSGVRSGTDGSRAASALMDPWRDCRWIDCADGKRRPVPTEPALFPLANGVPNRVGLLRGSGNAIVPQVAAHFIQAALEALGL